MVAKSCAIAHVVSCWLHIMEAQVQAQITPYQLFDGHSGAESGFSLCTLIFSCQLSLHHCSILISHLGFVYYVQLRLSYEGTLS
jgi:hypothetical protein